MSEVHERVDPTDENVMKLSRLGHIKRYKKAADLLSPGMKVLDFGCGAGYGSQLLAEHGAQVTAYDVSAEAIVKAEHNFPHSDVNFTTSLDTVRAERLDMITMFEVLEHLEDPKQVLRDLCQILKPGGKFALSCPNGKNTPNNNDYHLTDFLPNDLLNLIQSAGFRVDEQYGQYVILGAASGFVHRIFGYETNTQKSSGLIPTMVDRIPGFASVFSNLYRSKITHTTGRTLYLVAHKPV